MWDESTTGAFLNERCERVTEGINKKRGRETKKTSGRNNSTLRGTGINQLSDTCQEKQKICQEQIRKGEDRS